MRLPLTLGSGAEPPGPAESGSALRRSRAGRRGGWIVLAVAAACAAGTGCGRDPGAAAAPVAARPTPATKPAALRYAPSVLGAPAATFGRPLVTHLQIVDLDQDGLRDVLYAEASTHSVRWIRQSPRDVFTESIIGENLLAPAHVHAADVQGNGRLDVLVASMGQLLPTNDRLGAVVVLENLDNARFRPRVLLERVARVTDVRAANLAGHPDGRLDLIVGQFGYAQGETRWMHNRGGWSFDSTIVSRLSGCVHTPVADFDRDGRPDFAALISQEWEEVHLFTHRGNAAFANTVVWGSTNEDYGSSGLDVADLNRDGLPDLLYTNGDGFDYPVPGARPWHSVQWLENRGHGRFVHHRIGPFPGAYSPRAADLDRDGDLDVIAVSGFADWSDPEAVSLQAWVNDGAERFTPVALAHRPSHLVAADVGDLDDDGIPEIVTGGLYLFPPYDDPSSVTLWRRQ